MEKRNHRLTQIHTDKQAALFPNVITETKDENGILKKAVDFEKLKQELLDDVIEGEEGNRLFVNSETRGGYPALLPQKDISILKESTCRAASLPRPLLNLK